MTESKASDTSSETWIDRQVRLARERGDLDNLSGVGQPAGRDWLLAGSKKRKGLAVNGKLPMPLGLRDQIERLPETVRQLGSERAVRELVADLNAGIVASLRAPSGSMVLRISRVDVERIVALWRESHPQAQPVAPPPEPPHRRSRSPRPGRTL